MGVLAVAVIAIVLATLMLLAVAGARLVAHRRGQAVEDDRDGPSDEDDYMPFV
jgi:hypothetical protein